MEKEEGVEAEEEKGEEEEERRRGATSALEPVPSPLPFLPSAPLSAAEWCCVLNKWIILTF